MRATTRILPFFFSAFVFALEATSAIPGIRWQKSYGGAALDHTKWICPSGNGGFIITGYTKSNDGQVTGNHGASLQQDAWVICINADGTLLWQKTLGGTEDDELTCICPSGDGGFIAAGFSRSDNGDVSANRGNADWWVVKLTANGKLSWQNTFGGTNNEVANAIAPTDDGGFIVAGYTESADGNIKENHGGRDYWVMKLDRSGTMQWNSTYGNAGNNTCHTVAQTRDGGYIVAGVSDCVPGDTTMTNQHQLADAWLLKLSGSGNVEWERAYGGSKEDGARSIVQNEDGSFTVAGNTSSNDGDAAGLHGDNPDAWIFRIASNGDLKWQQTIGGTGVENVKVIIPCKSGGYLSAGSASSEDGDVVSVHASADYFLIRMSETGQLEWTKTLGTSGADYISGLTEAENGDFLIAGDAGRGDFDASFSYGNDDVWLLRLSADTTLPFNPAMDDIRFYPNPSLGRSYLELPQGYEQAQSNLYDVTGQLLWTNNSRLLMRAIDLQSLPKGLYFLKITTPNGIRVFSVLNQQ